MLASGSPRRRELLQLLGLPFSVLPSEAEEANLARETASAMVIRLSQAKAQALVRRASGRLIIAADTTVSLDGEVLGKPASPQDAEIMLRRLRGRPHTVFSGVTLVEIDSGSARTELVESQVLMRDYSDQEIASYVASGDPLDKAGSYAIQYADFRPVARIVGCYANVMGFPLCHVYCMLREVGAAPADPPRSACDRFNHRSCDVAEQILGKARRGSDVTVTTAAQVDHTNPQRERLSERQV